MNKVKFAKKLLIILIITMLMNIIVFPEVNFAEDAGTEVEPLPEMSNPIKNPDAYEPGKPEDSPVTSKLTATIVKLLRNLGIIVAVFVVVIIGIKYMMAGAAEEKAQYKETLIPLVIGIVVLMCSVTLISSIAKWFE